MNTAAVQAAIDFFHEHGVREVVVAAGARNAPLVEALGGLPAFRTYPFFEERSGAFFALGRIHAEGRPVAVLTTSGTAAAECLPAMIEAHYCNLPLLAATADRPVRYRGTGAPQAIEQVGIFSHYAETDGAKWDRTRPFHLNLEFEEPLPGVDLHALRPRIGRREIPRATAITVARAQGILDDFLHGLARPVVLVGALRPEEREGVVSFLRALGAPVHLEPLSGLREDARLAPLAFHAGERSLGEGDGLLRLGGVPVAGFWRDLDRKRPDLRALSIAAFPFAGSARVPLLPISPGELVPSRRFDADLSRDRARAERLAELLAAEEKSEPGMFHAFSAHVSAVYLGNSLPIREWDLAAGRRAPVETSASRGANGIDGQLSTFYGIAASNPRTWAILGDLTTLYDLSAPWILPHLPPGVGQLVVVNNGGGKIFSRMFKDPAFQNRHAIGFAHWAAMWGLPHETWERVPREVAVGARVVEWRPDEAATTRFWKEYDRLWN